MSLKKAVTFSGCAALGCSFNKSRLRSKCPPVHLAVVLVGLLGSCGRISRPLWSIKAFSVRRVVALWSEQPETERDGKMNSSLDLNCKHGLL